MKISNTCSALNIDASGSKDAATMACLISLFAKMVIWCM